MVIIAGVLWVVIPRMIQKESNSSTESPKTLDGQIAQLSIAIKNDPQVIQNYIHLSQAYLQKVRETADVAYYQKISELMDKAEKIDPSNADIPATRASVELGRHHFKEGNAFAQLALQRNSHNHLNYGLLGDSQIELGQYTEATDSFQKMVDLRPDYSSYIRIAYIRELYGDTVGAQTALQKSIEFGSSFKENIAFAYVELGKLDMRDDLRHAEADFTSAIKILPDYPPALEGLGKVSFFKKDNESALAYFLSAYEKLPVVQYAGDIGDVYLNMGDSTKALQYYTLGELAFNTSAQSGVNTDLEESLYRSDHGLDVAKALMEAERAYVARPSVYAADYLAWALYKNNKFDEASKYAKDALRLGETDPLILFHQGMIAMKNGHNMIAKKYLTEALKINPYFSISQSGVARDALNSLK